MSFFDDASLAFLPSGAAGKDGKAYSIKPTDGTGDFTFSRGSNLAATRVGPTGLIEKGRENLLLQSNQFDTTWFNVRSTETGGQTDKDGGSTAWLLESTDASTSYVQQNVSSSGVQTFSVIAKKGTTDYIYLLVFGSNLAGQYFDLNNGTLATSTYTTIDASIEDLGGGWYRCSVIFESNVTHVTVYPADSGTSSVSAVGSNIYIQDAQVEIGLAATDYIESGSTTGKAGLLEDEPRFDYSGGATCPSLLLEPSRRNIAPQSEYFGSGFTTSGTTIDTNTTTSPEGLTNATKLVETATTGEHRLNTTAIPVTAGQDYTISVFAKKTGSGDRDFIAFDFGSNNTTYANDKVYFNLSTGAVATKASTIAASIKPYANGWYRCIATCEALVTDNASFEIKIADADNSDSYAGDISKGVYLWGFQVEDVQAGTGASYPTSYIPNHSGGTITRGADFPTTTISTDITDSTQGSVYFEFQSISATSTDVQNYITLNNSTIDNIRFGVSNTGGIFRAKKDSLDLFSHNFSISDPTAVNKMAFRWGLNDWKLYLNGSLVYTSTTMATFESGDLLELENGINNGLGFLGKVKQLLVFPTKLSDSELQTLTT
jgi:hypothetical protein